MARPPDKSSASQFNSQSYMQSWAANNPYYAPHVTYGWDSSSNVRTDAAARSGVVNTGGYTNVSPQDRGISQSNPMNWASPVRRGTAYDRFGNVNKQVGDVNLGLVLMGGFQFPGQAFAPSRRKSGIFGANPLAKWMNSRGTQGISYENRRVRNWQRERGWTTQLSHSISSNKAPGGLGQSSRDSTEEMYSTQETRLGTRAHFTEEELNKDTGEFGRTWAGFKPLSVHAMNPHYDAKLGQMFKTESVTETGFARRTTRRL